MGISKSDIGTTSISIVATLAVWETLVRIFRVPGFILPAPSAIIVEAVTRYQLYLYHSWITFYEMVVGFVLGYGTRSVMSRRRRARLRRKRIDKHGS